MSLGQRLTKIHDDRFLKGLERFREKQARHKAQLERQQAANACAFEEKNLDLLARKYEDMGVDNPEAQAAYDIGEAYFGTAKKIANKWDCAAFAGFLTGLAGAWVLKEPAGLASGFMGVSWFLFARGKVLVPRSLSIWDHRYDWKSQGRKTFYQGAPGSISVMQKAQIDLDKKIASFDPLAPAKRPGIRGVVAEWWAFQKLKHDHQL